MAFRAGGEGWRIGGGRRDGGPEVGGAELLRGRE